MHFIVFFNSPQNLTEKAVFTNAALPVIKNPKDVSDSTRIPSFPPYLIIWGGNISPWNYRSNYQL